MKDTMKMIMEAVSGIKDLLLHIVGLGVLVQLVFVGGFLGIDVVGNLVSLVTPFTSFLTSLPNILSISLRETPQSSTVSCNSAVIIVSASTFISASKLATEIGWIK